MGWLAAWTTTRARAIAAIVGWFAALLVGATVCGELLARAERPNGSTAWDSSITSWIVAHRTPGWTALARVLTTIGSQTVLIPLVGAVAVVLLTRRRFMLAGVLVTAWGGATLLYSLIKYFVRRPRPPSEIWLTHIGRSTTSFPSGHATQSLATFLALALVVTASLAKPAWPGRVTAIALAVGVGWSRVYLGVHWSTDVLAGWLIAALWSAIVLSFAGRSAPSGRRDPDEQGSGNGPPSD